MNTIRNYFFLSFLVLVGVYSGSAQSYMFGPKLGATLGTQNWNGVDRNALISYHGGVYIESYEEDAPSSFMAYLGYHKKGSSERSFGALIGSGQLTSQRQPFEFNNAVLGLLVKKRFESYSVNQPYYMFGVRLEYTLNTNLDQYLIYGGYFPLDPFVNKFNYGPIGGVGYEMQFSEFVGAFLEFSISPDISYQYEQPELANIISPIDGRVRNIRSQTIRNISFEISFGMRLLRKITYVD